LQDERKEGEKRRLEVQRRGDVAQLQVRDRCCVSDVSRQNWAQVKKQQTCRLLNVYDNHLEDQHEVDTIVDRLGLRSRIRNDIAAAMRPSPTTHPVRSMSTRQPQRRTDHPTPTALQPPNMVAQTPLHRQKRSRILHTHLKKLPI
jgi:hypothetical protein